MAEAPRTPLPSGYDDSFVDAVEDEDVCSICLLPLKEPVLTRCGHRFCKECLEEYFRRCDFVYVVRLHFIYISTICFRSVHCVLCAYDRQIVIQALMFASRLLILLVASFLNYKITSNRFIADTMIFHYDFSEGHNI